MKNLLKLVKDAIKHPRTREEIKNTFIDAGIIDGRGNLKEPYKDLRIY